MESGDERDRPSGHLWREALGGYREADTEAQPELVWAGFDSFADERSEFAGPVDWMDHAPKGDHRVERMEPELERRRDPEVRARAPEAPEQLGVLLLARAHEPAVCRDHVRRQQVVDRQAELPLQPAHAAPERQSRDARMGDDTDGTDEPERLRLVVELLEQSTTVCTRCPPLGIDLYAAHPREVDDDPIVAGR